MWTQKRSLTWTTFLSRHNSFTLLSPEQRWPTRSGSVAQTLRCVSDSSYLRENLRRASDDGITQSQTLEKKRFSEVNKISQLNSLQDKRERMQRITTVAAGYVPLWAESCNLYKTFFTTDQNALKTNNRMRVKWFKCLILGVIME